MNKWLRIGGIAAPVVASVGTVGIYLAVTAASGHRKDKNEPFDELASWTDIQTPFPDLHSDDFYNLIRMEGPVAIITENMVAKVINEVIKKADVVGGDIDYGYKIATDKKSVDLIFKWQGISKSYHLELTQPTKQTQ